MSDVGVVVLLVFVVLLVMAWTVDELSPRVVRVWALRRMLARARAEVASELTAEERARIMRSTRAHVMSCDCEELAFRHGAHGQRLAALAWKAESAAWDLGVANAPPTPHLDNPT